MSIQDESIIKKLDTIIGLLAIQGKGDDEKIQILRSLEMTIKEISDLTALPEGTIKTKIRQKRLRTTSRK